MNIKFSSKIKGILSLSGANLFSLIVSLVTSFFLPYYISIRDYGYWQLFILYTSYVGFFAFGFNDGVHLNYGKCEYDEINQSRFKGFRIVLELIGIIETIISIILITIFFTGDIDKFYVIIFAILNIIPTLLNGLFTYMNQSMLRFKEYAIGNIFEKVIFTMFMIVGIMFGFKNYLYYIGFYTLSRYTVFGYHLYSSKKVFTAKIIPLYQLKIEVINNFKKGIILMISIILNNSIIVGSRFFIEAKFGIIQFSAYSFSMHTFVIASQFIAAVASVFYPILKRCSNQEYRDALKTFDKFSSIIISLLLISYYPIVILVDMFYPNYLSIISYLFLIYPLFIFQCKLNLLIINAYKVKSKPDELVFNSILGIGLHFVGVFSAYYLFGSIISIAGAVLFTYVLWYYICVYKISHEGIWSIDKTSFIDAYITIAFVIINFYFINTFKDNLYLSTLYSSISYFILLLISLFSFKEDMVNVVKKTFYYLKD